MSFTRKNNPAHIDVHPAATNRPNRGLSCGCWLITLAGIAAIVGFVLTQMPH